MVKQIEKMGKGFRKLWNSPFLLHRLMAMPYISFLKLRGKTAGEEPPFIKCGDYAYYLGIGKCANSTIVIAIRNKYPGERIYLGDKKRIKRLNKNNFFFTFVRNPYARVLSAYTDKIKRNATSKYIYQFNGVLNKISGKDLSFEEFVKITSKIPDRLTDYHLKSYGELIEGNGLKMDFIGKLEDFEKDWSFISNLLGFDKVKNLKNKNITSKKANLKITIHLN